MPCNAGVDIVVQTRTVFTGEVKSDKMTIGILQNQSQSTYAYYFQVGGISYITD